MKTLVAVSALLVLSSACENRAEKCKKACLDKVAACAAQGSERGRLDCEVEQTKLAVDCRKACDK